MIVTPFLIRFSCLTGLFKLMLCYLVCFVASQQYDINLVIDGTADSPPPPVGKSPTFVWPVSWNQSRCAWNNNGWNCATPTSCSTNNNCGSPPSFMAEFSTQITADPCIMFQDINVTEYQSFINVGVQAFRLIYSTSSFYMDCSESSTDTSSNYYATLEFYTNSSILISTWTSTVVVADLTSQCHNYDPVSFSYLGGPYYGIGCASNWLTYSYDVTVPAGTAMVRLGLVADQGQIIWTVNTQTFTLFDTISFAAQTPPPVNCVWNTWTVWSPCNANCGGSQSRTRTSTPPMNGGQPCIGSDTQSQSCGPLCPIDCTWNAWQPWSSCNASCGGWQYSTRTFIPALFGGLPCTGPDREEQICTPPCYPINCTWNSWQPWSGCDVVCGGGIQLRYRTQNTEQDGGQPCIGDYVDSQQCGTALCPENCMWTNWQEWTPCSDDCNGVQQRNRTMVPEQYGGLPCVGTATEIQDCNSCGSPTVSPPPSTPTVSPPPSTPTPIPNVVSPTVSPNKSNSGSDLKTSYNNVLLVLLDILLVFFLIRV